MKKALVLMLVVLMLAGCRPASPIAIVLPLVPTATPYPTNTPYPTYTPYPTEQLTPTATLQPETVLLSSGFVINNWLALGMYQVEDRDCPYPCMTFASTSGLEAVVYIYQHDMGTIGVEFRQPVMTPDSSFDEMMTLSYEAMRASGVGQDVTSWIGDFGSMAIGTGDLYHQYFTHVLVQVLYSDGVLGTFILAIPLPPVVTPTVRPTPAPRTSFGDGVWLVGSDIAPGTYRTQHGDRCWWERLSCFDGTYGCIIAYEYANNVGTSIVEIRPSDAGFSSDDCGQWSLLP